MASYKAPLRDLRFVLHELWDAPGRLSALPGYEEASAELVDAALEGAAKLCEEVLQPLNRRGDEQGCRFENGVVRTPDGFAPAFEQFTAGGWSGLACDPEHGGQGLPKTFNFCVDEMVASANMAFGLYLILSFGAYRAINAAASEALKSTYLPYLASGEWTGTMCMTEPQCGTDLGLIRAKAVPRPDGRYELSGTKIFITGGEHDLSRNIVHLVLARTPDAPAGVKGISLFLVPKFLPKADGTPGARNGVFCRSIEEKMGIHGASTCVLEFEAAEAYLVGERNRGLRAMFTMMNHERLVVGVQGLAQGEVAYQNALAYARERRQGRAPGSGDEGAEGADPIIAHPDVRRMLLTAKAYNEAGRALCAWLGMQIDLSERHPEPEARERASDLVALLTPVVKGFFTDCGSEVCNLCLQVLGGHGYIRESGLEQFVRDARIAQIYEGTNGVQALDLVSRKLPMHDGRLVERFFHEVNELVRAHRGRDDLREFVQPLGEALEDLRETTRWLRARSAEPAELGAASSDYLRFVGLVSYAFVWTAMAAVAVERRAVDRTGFYAAKLATARFFMRRVLPQVKALKANLESGGASLMELEAEAF